MKKVKDFYKKNRKAFENFIFPIFLLLYPLIKLNQGVDVSDSTYSLGNYLFFDRMQGMWVISTYLSNVVGSLLVHLPGGSSLLVMNLYTGLIVSLLALLCFFLLKKEYPAPIVFLGEVLAISFCWIPTGILYNYMTYLFFTLGALLIYFGLTREKSRYLFFAGLVLGANVMVRFPNLTQAALILAVWYGSYLYYDKNNNQKTPNCFLTILQKTGICFSGYLIGFGIPFLAVAVQYGFGAYGDMMNSLMSIQNTDDTYSALSMVTSVIDAYIRSFRFMIVIWIGLLFGIVMFRIAKDRFIILKKVMYLAGIVLMLRFLWGRGMFSFRYYEDYSSMFEWGMVLLYLTLAVCIWMIVSGNCKKTDKVMASIVLVIILITPLGSNNYTCQNLNNLFLAAPFALYGIYRFCNGVKKNESSFAVISMAAVLVFIITIQSIGFHMQFVFRDGMRGEKRDTRIEESSSVEGMYTNQDNAEALTGLISFCNEHKLIGQGAVFFGDAPGLSYILHMPFAISTSWPDLDSYPTVYFEQELNELGDSTFILRNVEPATETAVDKEIFLRNYLQEKQYQPVYENDMYTVYQVKEINL